MADIGTVSVFAAQLSGVQPPAAKLWHLQVLRAVAATLVAIDHAWTTVLIPMGFLPAWSASGGRILGTLGVTTFFVISGFIMIRTTSDRFGSVSWSVDFAIRRLIRIVPVYWIATAIACAVAFKHHAPPLSDIARSLLFIPYEPGPVVGDLHPILAQGWTLNYEVFFYALFAVALAFRRRVGFYGLLAILGAIVAAGALLHPWASAEPVKTAPEFLTQPIIVLFAAGMLIAYPTRGTDRGSVQRPLLIAAAIFAVALGVSLAAPDLPGATFPLKGLFWLPGIAAVFLSVHAAPRAERQLDRAMEVLGDASYCTYLFGSFAMAILRLTANLLPHTAAAVLGLLVLVAAFSNASGYAAHIIVERPIGKLLSGLLVAPRNT